MGKKPTRTENEAHVGLGLSAHEAKAAGGHNQMSISHDKAMPLECSAMCRTKKKELVSSRCSDLAANISTHQENPWKAWHLCSDDRRRRGRFIPLMKK